MIHLKQNIFINIFNPLIHQGWKSIHSFVCLQYNNKQFVM